ncbi:MAG: trigger factor family protein, partial [Coriobacteriia bacterium]|nr:trigger factor family protein [Coriobacteriia bacterium]
MKTTVERLDPAKVRLTVNVPAVEVDEAIAAANKRIAKKVKIPGFRAGKAPKPMIDTHIGREAVIADAQDELLNESYGAALDAEGLRPLGQPEIGELDLMEAGKDFDFVAEVEVRPELTLSSTDGLSVNVSPAVATDHEIDAQIDATRDRFATLEPVEDRG